MAWGHENQGAVMRRAIDEMLSAGQYTRAAEALDAAQEDHERQEDAALVFLLGAALRLCTVCGQIHVEAERHLQAYQETTQREHELRRQIDTILDLIDEQVALDQLAGQAHLLARFAGHMDAGAPTSSRRQGKKGLWQRVRQLLGRPPAGAPLTSEEATAVLLPGPEEALPASRESEIVEMPGAALEPGDVPAPAVGPELCPLQDETPPPSPGEMTPAKTTRQIKVYCLGTFRVYNDEQPVERWSGRKSKSVLKYLVTHREHPIHVEVLMDLFWRDAEPESARRNLYQAIYHLRQALQAGDPCWSYIVSSDECYALHPEVAVWVDSEALAEHYNAGQRLERDGRIEEAILEYEAADNLYEGEFLAEDRYEEWPIVQRENLRHTHMEILDRLSRHYFDRAAFAACTAFCQKILAEDRCREDAHRRLMRCYLRQGQRNLALHQYHLCEEALRQELDVAPMPATTALYQQIQGGDVQFSEDEELNEK